MNSTLIRENITTNVKYIEKYILLQVESFY